MVFKCIGVGFAAAAVIAVSFSAHAADLGRPNYKGPAYTSPAYSNWTGFYVGLNAGYGMGKASVTAPTGSTGDFSANGALAGATLGYNFQTGSWVWGAEGDLDYSGMKGTSSSFCVGPCTVSNRWLGTARARIGYAGWNNWLPYLTAGVAAGSVKFEQGSDTNTHTKIGWTAGLGVEYALFTNWSVKGEYLYTDLGTSTCPAGTCAVLYDITTKFKANLIRLGVNYRF